MKNPSEYVKMRVLAAVDVAEGSTIRARIRQVSDLTFHDEEGQAYRFTWRTIETWRVRYNKHGYTAISSAPRADKGKFRKVEPETVLEAIEAARPFFRGHALRLSELYRVCIEKGLLVRARIAPNTFRRIVKKYEMLKPEREVQCKARLAFAKRHANQMWQADTLYGPFVRDHAGKPRQSRLIAFLDDASRLLCHGQFFFHENRPALNEALKLALYKRGVPEILYVDNGSIYANADIAAICARLGCRLCHTPVRDGAAKGKIERFFRTVRERFLCRNLDLSSLGRLNEQFIAWAEDDYNHQLHGTLQLKPIDRYSLDLARIRFVQPGPFVEELFFAEATRAVKADNTFAFAGMRFEAPCDLRHKTIHIRFDRANLDPRGKPAAPARLPVYLQGERRGEAARLDLFANDRAPAR
jgi:transposase InsO family protein